jgi:hypothetical protein
VLCGIGARLDEQPELLFLLRKVDQKDLFAKAGADLSRTKNARMGKVLDTGDLSEIFGIEMVGHATPTPPTRVRGAKRAPSTAAVRRR